MPDLAKVCFTPKMSLKRKSRFCLGHLVCVKLLYKSVYPAFLPWIYGSSYKINYKNKSIFHHIVTLLSVTCSSNKLEDDQI